MSQFDFADSPTPSPRPRPSSSVGLLLGVIAVLLLVIAGAGAYFVWQDRKDKQDRAELDRLDLKIETSKVQISLAWDQCAKEPREGGSDEIKSECDKRVSPLQENLFKLMAEKHAILSRHPDWQR